MFQVHFVPDYHIAVHYFRRTNASLWNFTREARNLMNAIQFPFLRQEITQRTAVLFVYLRKMHLKWIFLCSLFRGNAAARRHMLYPRSADLHTSMHMLGICIKWGIFSVSRIVRWKYPLPMVHFRVLLLWVGFYLEKVGVKRIAAIFMESWKCNLDSKSMRQGLKLLFIIQ